VSGTEYRIEYAIQRKRPEDSDFVEIGFGSSGGWGDLDSCTHIIGSEVQHGSWATVRGMPDPDNVMREISETES
jgi:hypothetical protein